MPTKQTELKTRLKIQPGRDPLVNEKPTLSDEDYIEYLKEYIAEGKERWEQMTQSLAEKTAKIKELETAPTKSRVATYFRAIIEGMSSAGVFSVEKCSAGINVGGKVATGDAYIAVMTRHAAGVAEIANRETLGRF